MKTIIVDSGQGCLTRTLGISKRRRIGQIRLHRLLVSAILQRMCSNVCTVDVNMMNKVFLYN